MMPHAEFVESLARENVRFRVDALSAVAWVLRHGKWQDRCLVLLKGLFWLALMALFANRFSVDPKLVAYALFGTLIGFSFLGWVAGMVTALFAVLLTNQDRLPFLLPPGLHADLLACTVPAWALWSCFSTAKNAIEKAALESPKSYEDAVLSGALVLIPYPE